ncbi:MAG: hypothetical protein QM763_24265 [Agriterribacter sp.]
MASVLEKEMYNYFTQLNEAEKKSVVKMLKTFVKGKDKIHANISIEQYNKELEEAEKQIEAGSFITHEDLEKEMRQW